MSSDLHVWLFLFPPYELPESIQPPVLLLFLLLVACKFCLNGPLGHPQMKPVGGNQGTHALLAWGPGTEHFRAQAWQWVSAEMAVDHPHSMGGGILTIPTVSSLSL